MAYHVEVGPNIKNNTHHISLTDGEKTVGLIVCDSKGAADPFNISMSPNQSSSLRTKSGTTKYEDLDEPWSATAQDDWSGGRAQEDWETDTTKFYDSKRCQTAFNQIYCGPQDHYATGLKDAVTNYPGSVQWKKILPGTAYAIKIELSAAMQAGQVYILMRRRGTPKAGLTVSLCRNTPSTVLKTHTYTTDEITDVLSEWKKFTFANTSLAAGNYFITVKAETGESSGYWQVGFKQVENNFKTQISKGNTWQIYPGYDLYFRLAAADSGRKSRFFIYKQLTFALSQLVTGSPKLYVNGDLGMADSNSGQLGKIIDATKSWTVNQWAGCRVGIIQGTGIAETVSVWRKIVSNTATTLVLDSPYTITQDTTTTYVITDTERFYEIPSGTHGLTAYVTDIAIANDIIYFAQGDNTPIRKLKWVNGSWQSMADQYTHNVMPISGSTPTATTINNCATYLQTVRDTTGGLLLWRGQNNDSNHQISISHTAITDWLASPITVCNLTASEEVVPANELVDLLFQQMQEENITESEYDAYLDLISYRISDEQQVKKSLISLLDVLKEEETITQEQYNSYIVMISIPASLVNPFENEVYSPGVDFGKPDDVSVMYKISVGNITGEEHPVFKITLQSSEDNIVYEDVDSVEADTANSVLYMACGSKRRYRRIKIEISAGTKSKLYSLKVETVNHSKFIGSYTFNDSWGKITGLAEYPMMMNSQYKTLWIMREGMVHSISSEGTVDVINLPELATVMEEWNGKTSMVHNVYFYFRWMTGSIQRYYNQQLDSVGPDRDTGMPEERRGQIADMMGYPGRYFAAMDAGADGYSSVLLNNNSGWHEIYRAPNAGERITAMGYQAISGDRPDRLWISIGDDIVWLVMPSNTLKAYYDNMAEYIYESCLVSSWYSIGMVDVIKQWGSMNVMAENLKRDNVYIEADYQIDQDPTWYPMSADYTESPTQEVKFKDKFGISAKRLRYRLRLQTNDIYATPFIKAVVLKTVIKVPTKYNFGMSCRNLMDDVNLCGEVEDITPWQRLETLIEWADNATALRMRSFTYPFDDRVVFLDPPNISNLRERETPGMLMTISLNEI